MTVFFNIPPTGSSILTNAADLTLPAPRCLYWPWELNGAVSPHKHINVTDLLKRQPVWVIGLQAGSIFMGGCSVLLSLLGKNRQRLWLCLPVRRRRHRCCRSLSCWAPPLSCHRRITEVKSLFLRCLYLSITLSDNSLRFSGIFLLMSLQYNLNV